jgi:uncharacterized LabA/DUF88 family protein
MANNFAFIDGQNLHFGVKSMGWKLDHKKFRQYLLEKHDVTKAYIFLGFMEEHQDLYNVLQEAGFICFFKPLVRYDDGTIKGNVDADMVLQAMVDIENYDKAIIVSGDGDFAGLIRHLSMRNKLGRIIIPNKDKYSSLFDRIEGFDTEHVTYMNDLRSTLHYGFAKRPPQQRRQQSAVTKSSESKATAASKTQNSSIKNDTAKSTPRVSGQSSNRRRPQQSTQNRNKSSSAPRQFKPKSELEKSLIDTIDNA